MAKVTCSIRFLPLLAKDASRGYKLVDTAIEVIRESGLKYLVGPSETTVEGEFDEILELVRRLAGEMENHVERFILDVSFDYARSGVSIDEKTALYR